MKINDWFDMMKAVEIGTDNAMRRNARTVPMSKYKELYDGYTMTFNAFKELYDEREKNEKEIAALKQRISELEDSLADSPTKESVVKELLDDFLMADEPLIDFDDPIELRSNELYDKWLEWCGQEPRRSDPEYERLQSLEALASTTITFAIVYFSQRNRSLSDSFEDSLVKLRTPFDSELSAAMTHALGKSIYFVLNHDFPKDDEEVQDPRTQILDRMERRLSELKSADQ